jgi:hypothetical protein
LLDGLGGIFFGESTLFANTVEKFAAGSQLGDNVKLVLRESNRQSFVPLPLSVARGMEFA